ncbi:hypothetical protein Y032_0026g1373 [Ancylostoma ceylanicum]|uniref:Glycine zipper 2TM domain-containing protein n=1 Tax=Ancylostoma ceylanicum TaxID=53326 RepID=A0A016UVH1_9BILA|nr:hypothetical protein Y032_0026g1373 [Ancylostoma ceylanicum]
MRSALALLLFLAVIFCVNAQWGYHGYHDRDDDHDHDGYHNGYYPSWGSYSRYYPSYGSQPSNTWRSALGGALGGALIGALLG